MDPIAFTIGPFTVRWYGLLIASAILIGYFGANRSVKKQGLNQDDFLSLILIVVVCGVICARLYYVIFEWSYYCEHPEHIIAIWRGGLAIHGGILGGLVSGILACRHYKINFWQAADIFAPWVVLAQAIGRWGNFFNQEAYGYAVDPNVIPWAMYIDGAYRHPTFLYESIWNFLTFCLLLYLSRKPFLKQGECFLIYLISYSAVRFFIEGLRTDSLMLGDFRIAQLMSITLIIVAVGVFIYRRKKHLAQDKPWLFQQEKQ